MFYSGVEEDDAEFNITTNGGQGSKLASLFSLDQPSKEQTLTYTAPKQPKKPETAQAASGAQASVLYAVVVHAYKLVEHQYASQGKIGAAILGSHEALSYKVLLYKGQQQHVAIATIGLQFDYKVQNNKYASFYDDRKDNWSILFDTDQNSIDFAKQIALARANSVSLNLSAVLTQDLTPGEGSSLEVGDSTEIKYTGWIFTNNTFGKVFDSNETSDRSMRVKLGKGKVIKGWEDGLLGAKKNMRRVLVIPPSLGYGSQAVADKIPPNSVLIFEIFVSKIKVSKDSRPDTPASGSFTKSVPVQEVVSEAKLMEQSDSPRHSIHSIQSNPDDSVRARGASLSEQFTQSPKSEKAKIISRMAKMGMPMLPMQGAVIAQPSSESENEEELLKRRSLTASPAREPSPKPIVRPRPIMPNVSHPVTENNPGAIHSAMHQAGQQSHQMAIFQPQYPGYTYPMASVYPQVPTTIAHQPSSVGDSHLPVLISENRTQNSEVRMALGKITDKVEAVLTKLEQSQSQGSSSSGVPYMDASSLQQNIDRIVQENIKWKADLDIKNSKITMLNEKICELLERNQKLVEESNLLMEKRSDTFQSSTAQSHTRLLHLEQDKVRLTSDLSESLSQIANLKLELQRSQDRTQHNIASSSLSTSRYEESVELMKSQINEKSTLVEELENQLRSTKTENKLMSNKVLQLEERITSLQSSQSLIKKDSYMAIQEAEAEKEKFLNEIEMLKTRHKDELESLQRRVKNVPTDGQQDVDSFELTECRRKLTVLQHQNEQLQRNVLLLESSQGSSKVSDLEAKLKRAMTGLYRSLQKEFSPETEYKGQQVLKVVLQTIRVVTVAMLEAESKEEQENVDHSKRRPDAESKNAEVETPITAIPVETNADDKPKETVGHSDDKPEETVGHSEDKPEETVLHSEDKPEETVGHSKSKPKEIVGHAEDKPAEAENQLEDENAKDGLADSDSLQNDNIGACENTENQIEDAAENELPVDQKSDQVDGEPTEETKNNTNHESTASESSSSIPASKDFPSGVRVNKSVQPFLKTKDDQTWKPQPPPPPLFDDDDDDDDDDWLK